MTRDDRGAAIGLPLLDSLRIKRPRLAATWLLITLNLLVFAAMLVNGAGLWHSPNNVQLAWGANFGPATKDGEWWRLGSALFLHFGLLHLAMNMVALWEGGAFVERMYGSSRFLLLYLVAGLVGNLLSLIVQGDHAVAGGASGAIFGIYGALLVFLWSVRQQLDSYEFRWLFWGAAAFSALTVGMGFAITGIDNAAHIGGFAGGCLAGLALLPEPASWRWRRSAAVALVLLVMVMVMRIPAPRYRWHEEELARHEISEFIGTEKKIGADWDTILAQGKANNSSFEQLASRVDSEVAGRYEQTFEQLSALQLNPNVPSAQMIVVLRRYTEERRDASRALAKGLRQHDQRQIVESLDRVRRAPEILRTPAVPHDK